MTHKSGATRPVPERQCDIVMAGGVTSGVVYPPAMVHLSRSHRFRGIGGTSAGAIAAAAVAAAELGRRSNPAFDSFGIIEQRFGALGGKLLPLFQPQNGARRLFGLAERIIAAKTGSRTAAPLLVAAHVLRSYWAIQIIAILLAVIAAALMGMAGWLPPLASWHPAAAVAAAVCVGVLCLLLVAIGLYVDIRRLRTIGFGMCPGPTQPGQQKPALMDWLHELIQSAAGKAVDDAPLTFGELRGACDDGAPNIDLRMMTTDLSLGIGYALPSLGRGAYYFKVEELARVLPRPVIRALEAVKPAEDLGSGQTLLHDGKALRLLPTGADMPVLLAVRMSLSFPVLFTAIPLYKAEIVAKARKGKSQAGDAADWRARLKRWLMERMRRGRPLPEESSLHSPRILGKAEQDDAALEAIVCLRRVWFSDGGITSNFPVRFFDSLVPTRPTFGISLEDRVDILDPAEFVPHAPDVMLPMKRRSGRNHDIRQISSLPGFLMAAVSTAREWQDRKQGRIPGWSERIARLYLSAEEGGLNLGMGNEAIGSLGERGDRAAALLDGVGVKGGDHDPFDFSEHQWRRFLLAHGVVTGTLTGFSKKWTGHNLAQAIASAQKSRAGTGADYPLNAANAAAMIADMQALAALAGRFDRNDAANPLKGAPAHIEITPHDG